MDIDKLLTEVQVWSVRAVQDRQGPLPLDILGHSLGPMNGCIVIEEHEFLMAFRPKSTHLIQHVWQERQEIVSLDCLGLHDNGHQLLFGGGG